MNMLQVSYQQALADLDAVLDQAVEQAGVLVIDHPGKPRVALLEKGLLLYSEGSDKFYSITDCISMVIMKQLGIQSVLTHDKHFTQEGFTIIFQKFLQ